MKKLLIFALVLTTAVLLNMPALSAAGTPAEIAEVAAELHPPNEVMRELHPDMYKSLDTVTASGDQAAGKYRPKHK